MPKVTINTALVSVELEGNEASVDDLRKKAIETLGEAIALLPRRNELGFGPQHAERRGAPTHVDIGVAGWLGFAPAHAEEHQ